MWLARNILLVAAGGAMDSALRYSISLTVKLCPKRVVWNATLTVNVLGAWLIGFLVVLLQHRPEAQRESLLLLLTTGFCEGFTTFSTFSLELLYCLQAEAWDEVLLYLTLSVVSGVGAVY